jgi:hypothetical protein
VKVDEIRMRFLSTVLMEVNRLPPRRARKERSGATARAPRAPVPQSEHHGIYGFIEADRLNTFRRG